MTKRSRSHGAIQTATVPLTPPLGQDRGAVRLLIGFAFAFVALTLAASRPQPEADVEIVEAIHAEADQSRRQALRELRLAFAGDCSGNRDAYLHQ